MWIRKLGIFQEFLIRQSSQEIDQINFFLVCQIDARDQVAFIGVGSAVPGVDTTGNLAATCGVEVQHFL